MSDELSGLNQQRPIRPYNSSLITHHSSLKNHSSLITHHLSLLDHSSVIITSGKTTVNVFNSPLKFFGGSVISDVVVGTVGFFFLREEAGGAAVVFGGFVAGFAANRWRARAGWLVTAITASKWGWRLALKRRGISATKSGAVTAMRSYS